MPQDYALQLALVHILYIVQAGFEAGMVEILATCHVVLVVFPVNDGVSVIIALYNKIVHSFTKPLHTGGVSDIQDTHIIRCLYQESLARHVMRYAHGEYRERSNSVSTSKKSAFRVLLPHVGIAIYLNAIRGENGYIFSVIFVYMGNNRSTYMANLILDGFIHLRERYAKVYEQPVLMAVPYNATITLATCMYDLYRTSHIFFD